MAMMKYGMKKPNHRGYALIQKFANDRMSIAKKALLYGALYMAKT